MSVDTKVTSALLEGIETQIDKNGWDRRPSLYVLQRDNLHPDTPGDTAFALTAIALPVMFDGDTVGGLIEFAVGLAQPDADLDALTDGFVGFAFVCEAWIWAKPGEAPDPSRSLADQPGSVECRQITAIDTTGTMHVVFRLRGKPPRTDRYTLGQPDTPTGRLVEALRLATSAVADTLPDGSHQLPTVAELLISKLRPGPVVGDRSCTCVHWMSRHIARTGGRRVGACADKTPDQQPCGCNKFTDAATEGSAP